jgi:hypothetical protein
VHFCEQTAGFPTYGSCGLFRTGFTYRGVAMTSIRVKGGQAVQVLRAAGMNFSHGIQMAVEQTLSCRECDQRVNFFERVCPRCGAYGPARVPFRAAAILMVVPLLLVLVYHGLR